MEVAARVRDGGMGEGEGTGLLFVGRLVALACVPEIGEPARLRPGISGGGRCVSGGCGRREKGPTGGPGLQQEERGDARAVSDGWLTGGPGWRGGERAVRGDAG